MSQQVWFLGAKIQFEIMLFQNQIFFLKGNQLKIHNFKIKHGQRWLYYSEEKTAAFVAEVDFGASQRHIHGIHKYHCIITSKWSYLVEDWGEDTIQVGISTIASAFPFPPIVGGVVLWWLNRWVALIVVTVVPQEDFWGPFLAQGESGGTLNLSGEAKLLEGDGLT